MTKYKCRISTSSFEQLEKKINQYFFSNNYQIVDDKLFNASLSSAKMEELNERFKIHRSKDRIKLMERN